MNTKLSLRKDAGAAVVVFGILILTAIWLDVWWDLKKERDTLVMQGGAETSNLSRVLAEHAQRTIMGLDQTLLVLKADYERNPRQFSVNAALASMVALRQASVQVARIDAQGRLADSTVSGFTSMDLSDREHFRVHAQAQTRTLFISKPVKGRASGQWSIQLTRRLETADGRFDGVMVVSMDPQYLSGIYSSVDLGSHGLVMLVGNDGVVRAASDGAVGQSLHDAQSIQRIFALGTGSQQIVGPADDVSRIGTATPLSSLPLAIWVGRSQADILAVNDRNRENYAMVGVGFSAVVMIGMALLFRVVRSQSKVARDLSVKKAELLSSRETLRSYAADLERIADVAAHDLQEPLRRVVAYAQLLSTHADDSLDQQGRDYVAHVVNGAIHMRKLVKDLESFVAVDHLPVPRGRIDATAALGQATERLENDLREAGVAVMVDVLPQVAADMGSLTEVFVQLLDNSVRYRSPDRQPVVHISARMDGNNALISVRDNGRGIESRNLPRVFEIFNRLNGFDQPGHTGIGLAIVRRMVERMGGRIWVESVVGEGTTFRFSIPLTPLPGVDHGEMEAVAA